MAGRQSILHKSYEQKRTLLLEALRVGAFMDTACAHAGIGESTVYRALQQADEPGASRALREFRDAVNEARGRSTMRALATIAADSSWQSKAWYLERTQPDRYGRRIRQEHVGSGDGEPVQVVVRDEHKDAVARAILEGLAAIAMQPPDDTG